MASGYFPLDRHDEHRADLLRAIELVQSVIDAHMDAASENCTPEGAVADGIYLGYLRVAADLIRKCLREEV